MTKHIYLLLGIVPMFLIMSSCGTLAHGPMQTVAISSYPIHAKVTINGEERGITPMSVDLRRAQSHVVKIELLGYQPYELILNKKLDSWVALNALNCFVGLAIDYYTGSLFTLSPEEVMAELRDSSQFTNVVSNNNNELAIFLTMKPDPNWTKIDTLQKTEEAL